MAEPVAFTAAVGRVPLGRHLQSLEDPGSGANLPELIVVAAVTATINGQVAKQQRFARNGYPTLAWYGTILDEHWWLAHPRFWDASHRGREAVQVSENPVYS